MRHIMSLLWFEFSLCSCDSVPAKLWHTDYDQSNNWAGNQWCSLITNRCFNYKYRNVGRGCYQFTQRRKHIYLPMASEGQWENWKRNRVDWKLLSKEALADQVCHLSSSENEVHPVAPPNYCKRMRDKCHFHPIFTSLMDKWKYIHSQSIALLQLIAACMDGSVFLSINPSYLSIDEKKIVQLAIHIHVTNLLCFVFVSKQNTKGWSHVCMYVSTNLFNVVAY